MSENTLDKIDHDRIKAMADELTSLYIDAEEATEQMQHLDLVLGAPDVRVGPFAPNRDQQLRAARNAAWTSLEILRHNAVLTFKRIDKILDAANGKFDPDPSPHCHPEELPCNVMCPAHPHTVKTEQCTASSWRGKSGDQYGPGGFNRCVITEPGHEQHQDDFGNVFVLDPKFRVIKNREEVTP